MPREYKCSWHEEIQFTQASAYLARSHSSSSTRRAACSPRWMTPPSCVRRIQVQRRQARGSASCVLLWGALCPSSSSQTRVLVARRRGPDQGEFDVGEGMFKHKTRRQAPTAFARSLDKARSESRDVETTSLCLSRCVGFATREVQSEASARLRRPSPQSSPVRRKTRPAAEPPPVLAVEDSG